MGFHAREAVLRGHGRRPSGGRARRPRLLAAVTSQTVLAEGTTLRIRIVKTVANDFDSGWHVHPGPAIVQIQEGSMQITQGGCTPKTVNAGETFTEVPFSPVRAVAKR